ncbi:MAG: 30S ribosomal protein S20 [Clostridiales Family XIII bacterium]|jgi:small subunit ribosomal protein S20|nr:30S ribosomal protein S20 [Clostridiales Family XIII bacterium]
MANIKSAKKRIGVIQTKTNRNKRVKSHLKETLRSFETALEEGDKDKAKEALVSSEKKLQQAASKGTIHKNAADRKVSRLNARFAKAFNA